MVTKGDRWGMGEGWTGGLGLAYAPWGIWNDCPNRACCKAQRTLPSILWWSMWGKNLRIDMCMCMTGSFCCTAEMITALQVNYTSIKLKKNKNKVLHTILMREEQNTKNMQNNENRPNKQKVPFLKFPVTAPRLIPIHTWLLVVFLQRQVSWDCSSSRHSLPDDDDDEVFRVRSVPGRLFGGRLSSLGAVGGGERISCLKKQSSNKQPH